MIFFFMSLPFLKCFGLLTSFLVYATLYFKNSCDTVLIISRKKGGTNNIDENEFYNVKVIVFAFTIPKKALLFATSNKNQK